MSARKPPCQDPAQAEAGPDLDDEERRLFEREYADVRPLKQGPTRVASGIPVSGQIAGPAKARGSASPDRELQVERQDGQVTGASYGVSVQTLRELARGEIRGEAVCDLHGLVAERARRRIEQFIEESVRAKRRAVLIICGRGRHSGDEGPVLREVVVEALGKRPVRAHVLAFATASPARGGDGVFAVLLRRPGAAG